MENTKNMEFINKVNKEHNFKHKRLDYIFLIISFTYFLILNFAFDRIFITTQEEKAAYDRETLEKKYSLKRVGNVFLNRIKLHSIAFTTLLFFVGFVIFLYFKFKITDQKNTSLYNTNKGKVQQHIESIYSKLNYDTNLSNNLFKSWIYIFLLSTVIIFLFSNLFVYFVEFLFSVKTFTNSFLLTLNLIIILIGVGFIYSGIKNTSAFNAAKKNTKVIIFIKFIEATILYIPCLLNDIISGFSNSKEGSGKFVYNVLLIEILLLFIQLIVPIIDKWISTNLGNTLLHNPIYLDVNSNYKVNKEFKRDSSGKIILKTKDDILKDNSSEVYGLTGISGEKIIGEQFYREVYDRNLGDYVKEYVNYKIYDQNFSVSFWTYFNADDIMLNESSTSYQTILNISKNPEISYNPHAHKMKFYIKQKNTNSNGTIIIQNIPQQKWNHFVVNYESGTFDVLMNGELIETRKKIVLNYEDGKPSEILVGQENGLNGRITNVAYFNKPLTKPEIDLIYNMKKHESPPSPGGLFLNSNLIYNNLINGSNKKSTIKLDENNPLVYIYGKAKSGVNFVFNPVIKYIQDPVKAVNDGINFVAEMPYNIQQYGKKQIDYILFDFDDTIDLSGNKKIQYSDDFLSDLKYRKYSGETDKDKYRLCSSQMLSKIFTTKYDNGGNITEGNTVSYNTLEPAQKQLYYEIDDLDTPAHLINYHSKEHPYDMTLQKCFTNWDSQQEKNRCEEEGGTYDEYGAKCYGLTKEKCGHFVYKKKIGSTGEELNEYELDNKGVPDMSNCLPDTSPDKIGEICGRNMGVLGGTYIDIYDPRNETGGTPGNRQPYCIDLYKKARINQS